MNYISSSLILLVFAILVASTLIKEMIFVKFMVLVIHAGGIVVFISYISCLCVYVDFMKMNCVFLMGVAYTSMNSYHNNLNTFMNLYSMFIVGAVFRGILTFHSMNLSKISGSMRL